MKLCAIRCTESESTGQIHAIYSMISKKGRITNIITVSRSLSIALRLVTLTLLYIIIILLIALAPWSTINAQGETVEFFYSVTPIVWDSDSDGYDDTVTLQMDADTTGGFIAVTADLFVDDSWGFQVVADTLTWNIYYEETEYSEFEVTITEGDPQYFYFYLYLYDDEFNLEDTWEGSFYLYRIGYGTTTFPTATPFITPFPTGTPGGISPDDGGLDGAVIAGISVAAFIGVLAVVFFGSRVIRGRVTVDPRIRELRAQMERWRQEGYDVSELEDLFK